MKRLLAVLITLAIAAALFAAPAFAEESGFEFSEWNPDVPALKALKVGDPRDPETAYGPLISEKAAEEVEKQIRKDSSMASAVNEIEKLLAS